MNKREFLKELHQLYLADIQTWMKNEFLDRKINVKEQTEAQENAMKRAILKHDGKDYDYLEWAADGMTNLENYTLEDAFEELVEENYFNGILSGHFDYDEDEEIETRFNRYKKYFTEKTKAEIAKEERELAKKHAKLRPAPARPAKIA